MSEVTGDWEDQAQEHRERQRLASLDLAKCHAIFETDPRGQKLLDLWRDLAKRRVPVNASIDEYARAEAIRSFVQTIEDQLKFAKTEGR